MKRKTSKKREVIPFIIVLIAIFMAFIFIGLTYFSYIVKTQDSTPLSPVPAFPGAVVLEAPSEEETVFRASPAGFVPGEVIVKLKPDRKIEDIGIEARGYKKLTVGTNQYIRAQGLDRLFLLKVADTEQALQALQKNPHIEYAEPNYIAQIASIPNDEHFRKLWGLDNYGQFVGSTKDADIDAPEAWNLNTGSSDVVVAVIDTGVDYAHEDLAGNMWVNEKEIPNNGRDDDGNGYVDDYRGWDFYYNDNDPFDDHSHGTHIAGTIAAVGNNGIGVAGVSWKARIMPLKFTNANGMGTTVGSIAALEYAIMMGAKTTSNSYGCKNCWSAAFHDTIEAANNAGVLFVAAAGNYGTNNDIDPFYPASYDNQNIIAVAATHWDDTLASFSNYGSTIVDLGAPGRYIYSTIPKGSCVLCNETGYKYLSGTSMATPHVSGAAAVIKAQNPGLTHLQIKSQILNTVDPLSSLQGKTVTGGRLNIRKALGASENNAPVANADGPYTGTVGVAVTFDGSASFDPDGGWLNRYYWLFGDGSNSSGVNPSHAYAKEGIYTIYLTVFDGHIWSSWAKTTATITGVNNPPVADANGPYEGIVGVTVIFDGSRSSDPNGNVLTYHWNFWDGALGSGVKPSHTYDVAGSYLVSLVVNDGLVDSQPSSTTANIMQLQDTIVLDATVVKQKGQKVVELQWEGATSTFVDIYRNNVLLATTENNGFYVDDFKQVSSASFSQTLMASWQFIAALFVEPKAPPGKRWGKIELPYTYQVCRVGEMVCSNTVTITL